MAGARLRLWESRSSSRTRGRIAAAAVAVAACVAGVASTASVASPKLGADDPSISFAIANNSLGYTPFFLAKDLGYWKSAGVDVNMQIVGATAATLVAAGQYDLTAIGTATSFPPTAQGKAMTIVAAHSADPGAIASAARLPIRSYRDFAGKNILTTGVNTSAYGALVQLNAALAKAGLSPAQSVPIQGGNFLAALESNSADGVASVLASFGPGVQARKLRLIVNPRTPQGRAIVGGPVAAAAIFGLRDDVLSKRLAVQLFLTGIVRAQHYLQTHTAKQVASVLSADPAFAGIDARGLATSLNLAKPFIMDRFGYISAKRWAASIKSFKTWFTATDLDSSTFSYRGIVDMSYLSAALKSAKLTKAQIKAATANNP